MVDPCVLAVAVRRREFITLLSGAMAAWPLAAQTQQATKIPQIGILSLGRGDKSDASLATLDAFMPALRELGYIEGQNIAVDRKFADGDANKLSGLAQELVEHRLDAIVALSTPAVRAAKRATSAIPIIGIAMADPVQDELASSLARPGGNVTGTAFLGPELVSKRLQLLKEIVPGFFSRRRVVAPPCIWRANHGRHVEGDRERRPIPGNKTSTRSCG
jgi:putative tryptophan/tyrosine transport system substrate-binding protein